MLISAINQCFKNFNTASMRQSAFLTVQFSIFSLFHFLDVLSCGYIVIFPLSLLLSPIILIFLEWVNGYPKLSWIPMLLEWQEMEIIWPLGIKLALLYKQVGKTAFRDCYPPNYNTNQSPPSKGPSCVAAQEGSVRLDWVTQRCD